MHFSATNAPFLKPIKCVPFVVVPSQNMRIGDLYPAFPSSISDYLSYSNSRAFPFSFSLFARGMNTDSNAVKIVLIIGVSANPASGAKAMSV